VAENDDERERWNRRWSERGVDPLGRPPSGWLAENRWLLLQPAGRRALDVACGDGRNAVYLAGLGFSVDAIDISDVAIGGLGVAARAAGLAIDARRVDLGQAPLPVARYDVVVTINYLQRDLFPALAAALLPGGILIAETFTRAHVTTLGGRLSEQFLLGPGELRTAFAQLRLLRYREGVRGDADRPRAVAGLVARRLEQPTGTAPAGR
jgi:tellurite methyltransferase